MGKYRIEEISEIEFKGLYDKSASNIAWIGNDSNHKITFNGKTVALICFECSLDELYIMNFLVLEPQKGHGKAIINSLKEEFMSIELIAAYNSDGFWKVCGFNYLDPNDKTLGMLYKS